MKVLFNILILMLMLSSISISNAEGVFINSSIKEASGIVYNDSSNSLFVVDDEGIIFEISTKGKVLREKYLGDFDLEGITLGLKSNELILAIEGSDNLLFVDIASLKITREISIDRKWNGVKILKKDKSHGIEGIHNFDGRLFLVNQSYNVNPEKKSEDPSMILEVQEDFKNNEFYIYSVIFFPFPDLAGMTEKNGLLYLISDDKDLIIMYNLKTNEVVKQINSPIHGDQEGITFDNDGNLYIAVDGEGIYKTKLLESK